MGSSGEFMSAGIGKTVPSRSFRGNERYKKPDSVEAG
jgi:hypothetical protein